jgi:hypothetical protein
MAARCGRPPLHSSPAGGSAPEPHSGAADGGTWQAKGVAARYPDAVARLSAAYDRWGDEVRPRLVNENARGPAVNPFESDLER